MVYRNWYKKFLEWCITITNVTRGMVNWKKEFFSRCISKILFIDTEKLSKMHISLQVFFRDFGDRFGITYFEMMIMMVIMMMVNYFCGMVDQQKALRLTSIVRDPYHRNLQHAVSRTWTCTEPEFRLCWMKLCSSDYTTAPLKSCSLKLFFKSFLKIFQKSSQAKNWVV